MLAVLGACLVAIAPVRLPEAPRWSSPWRVVAPQGGAVAEPARPGIRGPAVAPGDADGPVRREAARAFADGEAAFVRGDYDDAAERFARAHALVPHPWTLYNQAVSLRHAGDAVAAWRAFGELESIATTPDERAEAARERAALRDRVARVELHGPADAIACIDGDRVALGANGRAQWVGRPGTHRLATHGGERTFAVASGSAVRIDVAPAKRRAPRARGWLVAAIVGSAGGLGGGVAAAVLAEPRNAKIGAAVGASAAGTALVASIVALAIVERDVKRERPAALPCELVGPQRP